MASIQDDRQVQIREPSLVLETRESPVKHLDYKTADLHLRALSRMLKLMSRLVYEKVPDARGHSAFQKYLLRLGEAAELIALRNLIESKKPNSDVSFETTILRYDSGFPLFVRDFHFLEHDKERAPQVLRQLPDDNQIVQDALFTLFRGYFPGDVVFQKFMRDYFSRLAELELPAELRFHREVLVKEKDGRLFYKRSVERFEPHYNLPRFYTFYITTPESSFFKVEWRGQLEEIVQQVFSRSAVALEISSLARALENIEGVNVQGIERFDVGPFYNRNTENPPNLSKLLEQEPDGSILMMRKSNVVRTGENRRRGYELLRGLLRSDTVLGVFSPVLEGPQYALMPHRLIQRAHHLNLQLKGVKMYGITNDGGLVD